MRIVPPGSVEIEAGSTAEIPVAVDGPGTVGLRYLLFDPATRTVVDTGDARGSGGRFVVEIDRGVTGDLFPGLYELTLLAHSDAVARVVERTLDVDVE